MAENEKEAQIRRQLGIPPNADVTIIDMGPGKKPEPKTFGWTDDQIRGKSAEELDSLVTQADIAVDSLSTAMREAQDRAQGLRRVRSRKNDLGS